MPRIGDPDKVEEFALPSLSPVTIATNGDAEHGSSHRDCPSTCYIHGTLCTRSA